MPRLFHEFSAFSTKRHGEVIGFSAQTPEKPSGFPHGQSFLASSMVSGLRFPMMKTLRKASIITGERICRICQIVDDYPHMEMLVFTWVRASMTAIPDRIIPP